MPNFVFKAKKSTGEIYTGEQTAGDRYEVYRFLKNAGDEIISVEEHRKYGMMKLSASIPFLSRVPVHEKIILARNLGSMIEAGLALSRAISVIERQSTNRELKKILVQLNSEISKGKTFSSALSEHKKVFSPLFIAMVHAGEESGMLAQSLKIVALQMDRAYALERRIKGAMIYPGLILCVMILIAVLMLTYIVPTLMKTFTELKLDLPMSTKFVLGTSNLFINHGLIVLISLVAVSVLFYMWSKKDQGKRVIHKLILKVPVIGNIIKEVNSARTARTMSSLLSSGVDMVEALNVTRDVIQNVYYKDVLDSAREIIKKGRPMSEVFANNTKLYPVFLGEMISVGEETGKISEMLLNVAVFYEEDVEEKTKDMSAIIEPFLMVIIGIAVGFFALAMISPMYSLVNVI